MSHKKAWQRLSAHQRIAQRSLALIVHYASKPDEALDLVSEASTATQLESYFTNARGEYKSVKGLTQLFIKVPSLSEKLVSDTVEQLPNISNLEVVILSKRTFSVAQVNLLVQLLGFYADKLVSLSMWIKAGLDTSDRDEPVSNLERLWPLIDEKMPELRHLSLEIQNRDLSDCNFAFFTHVNFRVTLSTVLCNLESFSFGSMDHSTLVESSLAEPDVQASQQMETLELGKFLPDSTRMDGTFASKYRYIGVAVQDWDNLDGFCRQFPRIRGLQVAIPNYARGAENRMLECIRSINFANLTSLRMLWSTERTEQVFAGSNVVLPNIQSLVLGFFAMNSSKNHLSTHNRLKLGHVVRSFPKLQGLVLCVSKQYNCATCQANLRKLHYPLCLANSQLLQLNELKAVRLDFGDDTSVTYPMAIIRMAREMNKPKGKKFKKKANKK